MQVTATTATRYALLGTWVVLFAVVVGAVVLSRVGPLMGVDPVIIRSGSMAPAIPVGALVIVRAEPLETIGAGDVVTLRMRNGQLLTHRVTRVAQLPDGTYLETKGDANEAPDPVLVPTRIGGRRRDATCIPYAGYLLAYLSLPTGMASVSSFLAACSSRPGCSRSRGRHARGQEGPRRRPVPRVDRPVSGGRLSRSHVRPRATDAHMPQRRSQTRRVNRSRGRRCPDGLRERRGLRQPAGLAAHMRAGPRRAADPPRRRTPAPSARPRTASDAPTRPPPRRLGRARERDRYRTVMTMSLPSPPT